MFFCQVDTSYPLFLPFGFVDLPPGLAPQKVLASFLYCPGSLPPSQWFSRVPSRQRAVWAPPFFFFFFSNYTRSHFVRKRYVFFSQHFFRFTVGPERSLSRPRTLPCLLFPVSHSRLRYFTFFHCICRPFSFFFFFRKSCSPSKSPTLGTVPPTLFWMSHWLARDLKFSPPGFPPTFASFGL